MVDCTRVELGTLNTQDTLRPCGDVRRGAYMHQLQILSQQADHQAPSASSTQSTAMLASLLASNPALLQAMQLPPAVVDAGVGAVSSGGASQQQLPEAGTDLKPPAAGASSANGAAATLQLGTAGNGLQTTTLVTKPRAAVAPAAVQPAFSAAPPANIGVGGGPTPITSGGVGGSMPVTSVLRATKSANSAFAAAGPSRSLDLSSATAIGGAALKRSAIGDLKPVAGRRDNGAVSALPPKKRLDSVAVDSTGDAERDAYSSLARMRCAVATCASVVCNFVDQFSREISAAKTHSLQCIVTCC